MVQFWHMWDSACECSGMNVALLLSKTNQSWLTLTAVFVLREDITVIAHTHIRARSVLAGAAGLAEASVHGTFIDV